MISILNTLINWIQTPLGVTIVGGVLATLITRWIIYPFTSVRNKRDKKRKTATFRIVSCSQLTPTDIMHDRGAVINGFDKLIYFSRKGVDDHINKFIQEDNNISNLLIVTGLLSSGKSRAVYEALKKSNVKNIALCYDSDTKETNYVWSLAQWKEAIVNLKKERNCILCIDSISDIKFTDASTDEEKIQNWVEIFKTIHSLRLRCIVTLAKPSQDAQQSFADDFLDRTDEFTGEANSSTNIRVVDIREISKTDDIYIKCKSAFACDYSMPVVGDFINNRFCESIWQQCKDNQRVIRLFVAIILALKYNPTSRCVAPCNYLKNIYSRLAKDANVTDESLDNDFIEACDQLESLKVVRFSSSRAVCVICAENSFVYIKERLFDCLDTYHEQKLINSAFKPQKNVAWIEPYIRSNDNLYIEKKQAELIISIDPLNPGLYKDAVIFSSAKNTMPIAELVRKKFNKQFFTLDENNCPKKLKPEYNDRMEAICDMVGVFISRTCRTYAGAETDLQEYLRAGVQINENIICELLRIAAEEDVTTKDKEKIKQYASQLADEQFGDNNTCGFDKLLAQSTRFNTSYESISDNLDALRIAHGFGLQADSLKRTFAIVKDAFDSNQENQLEEESGKTYQKLWNSAMRSLFYYCKKVTEHIRSKSDLELLLAILCTDEIQARCKEIEYELKYINRYNDNYAFIFMNPRIIPNVANTVLAYNPMGYIGECKEMTVLLAQKLDDTKYKYAFNAYSLFRFVGSKEEGVMGIIPDFNNSYLFYTQLRDTLKDIAAQNPQIQKAFSIWLYPLIDKIKNEQNLLKAQKLIPSVAVIMQQREGFVVYRKLINALIYKAPSYQLASSIYEEYKVVVAERIDTINAMLGHIKNEVGPKELSPKKKEEYIKLTLKWIDNIQSIEWNKFTTNAGRVNSVLTSINARLENEELKQKITSLHLPDENDHPTSRLYKKINALKEKEINPVEQLRAICRYYNSARGEDIYESSDYITHVIKYAFEYGKHELTQQDIENVYNMIIGDEYHLPIDELFQPKDEFYRQVLYKVLDRERFHFETRWNYIKYAYLRLLACDTLPIQRDKHADLLEIVLKPTAYNRPNDVIEIMRHEILDFVNEHPFFITMYMSLICKFIDLFARTLKNAENPKILHNVIVKDLRKELDHVRPVPHTDEEYKVAIKTIIIGKLDRINKLILTAKVDGKPLPFHDQFGISISKINERLTERLEPWYMKGPFLTLNDTIRHEAWSCYIEGKTNLNYRDLLPKIIFFETKRICEVMLGINTKSRNNTANFQFLKKELILLKEQCSAEEFDKAIQISLLKAYDNQRRYYSDKTGDWSEDVFAQFAVLCNTQEDLKIWNELRTMKYSSRKKESEI